MESRSLRHVAKVSFMAVLMVIVLTVLSGCNSGIYQSMRKTGDEIQIPEQVHVYVGELDKNYLTDWYHNDTTELIAEVFPLWTYCIDGGSYKYFTLVDDYKTDDETTHSVKKGDIAIKQPVTLEIYLEDQELDHEVVVIGHIIDADAFAEEVPSKCQISFRSTDGSNESKMVEALQGDK
ncbi:MAG: hypothetical protein ACI4BI_06860 [Anaerotardibacter sp.]